MNFFEFSVTGAVVVFFCELLYYFLTVFLVDNIVDGHSVKAGAFSAALNFTSYLALFYFVKNFDYLGPACLGAFVGAILATEYDKRRRKSEQTNQKNSELN